jgi:hypothetical protein
MKNQESGFVLRDFLVNLTSSFIIQYFLFSPFGKAAQWIYGIAKTNVLI